MLVVSVGKWERVVVVRVCVHLQDLCMGWCFVWASVVRERVYSLLHIITASIQQKRKKS